MEYRPLGKSWIEASVVSLGLGPLADRAGAVLTKKRSYRFI
jgi:hypothetical protein